MTPKPTRSALLLASLAVLALVLVPAAGAQSSTPSFSKSFSPSTIGPGSISTLVFTITNSSGSLVTDLAFTDTLPSAVVVATPAQATTDCNGRTAATVSATEGGSTISLTDGTVQASSSCTVSVNVTSSTAGTHTNVSDDLTSSAGNSGSATADLTVATDRPGFSKSLSPSSVVFGGRSTLTFTIDNTANPSSVTALSFSDTFPAGMTVADPTNASTTCSGGTISATPGSDTVSYSGGFGDATVAASSSCTLSVDVSGDSVGVLENLSGNLSGRNASNFAIVESGHAGAVLTVTVDRLALSKSFVDDPVSAGSSVTLELTLTYLSRSGTATDIAFTDDLDAVLSGLAAVSLPSDPCGSGSSLSGTSVLSLSGGTLAAGASCTFSVTLAVPSGAAAGSYGNTTSAVSGNDGATPLSGEPASDVLFVEVAGVALSKSFTDDPVGAGGNVTLELTLDNQSGFQATDIAFSDELDVILSNAALPSNGFCGSGATASFVPASNFSPATITISGASLAGGESCTFQVTLDVADTAPSGIYPNVTSEVTATIDGETVTSDPASDDLEVVGGVQLSKAFTDDPVTPGDSVTLEFTLEHLSESASTDATEITFSDDLDAVLSGLASISPTQNDVCGAGSSLGGTSTLLFTGGTLQPGETCTFSVTLSVPASAAFGSHANTTSVVESTVSGVTATNAAAEDDLVIAGLTLSKEFLGDPALPGASVTLRFTIDNSSTANATDISFTDDLDDVLSGLAATGGTQNDVCGTGSSISDGGFLVFQGGSLAAGTSCTIDVPVAVPTSAEAGGYLNVASDFSADFGGGVVSLPDALDTLEVVTTFLLLEKEFVDDPVTAGDNATLRFTITNLSAADAVADIAFTDDLDAALSGLASISGSQSGVCGSGSSISGTSLLSFTGGSLAAGGSCSLDVVLSVPTGVSLGSEIVNTTSEITGTLGGLPVDGPPASDVLDISLLAFSKAFDGPVPAGGTVTLTFSIENLSSDTLSGIELTDDLSAVLSGLVATDTPKSDVCGSGSTISGTSLLTLTGGNLLGGGSCSITVDLAVPVSAVPGDYLNVSSNLRQDGAFAAEPARATLTVIEVQDSDDDGVLDSTDVCPGTAIPESVPTVRLGVNRFALVDGDGIFDTTPPPGGGVGPQAEFTIDDTRGCSCEQIIDVLGLGKGHEKFGCSLGAMRDWVALVSLLSQSTGSSGSSGTSSF